MPTTGADSDPEEAVGPVLPDNAGAAGFGGHDLEAVFGKRMAAG